MTKDHEWVDAKIRIPKGARLSTSSSTPGTESALLFDRKTGKTLGPAEVRVREGASPGEQLLATALTAAAALAITHAPEIHERVQADLIPAAKAKWDRFKEGRKTRRPKEVEAAATDTVAPSILAPSVGADGTLKAEPLS